jgi:hypothetical protein
VTHREVRDEALTGEPAGQPLSREIETPVQSADRQATWNLSSKSKHDCDLARRPAHELLPSSSDELSVGAAHFSELRFGEHSRARGNNSRTLLPRMRRQRLATAD